jgi:hypothetical protein
MPTISDFYEYAKLASASYVILDGRPLDGTSIAALANSQDRLPTTVANQTFNRASTQAVGQLVWTIPLGGYTGNDGSGFAATFFQKEGRKVLAIRGTEGDPSVPIELAKDLQADLGQIGFLGLALSQAVSMVNYLLRVNKGLNVDVPQYKWGFHLGTRTVLEYLLSPVQKAFHEAARER